MNELYLELIKITTSEDLKRNKLTLADFNLLWDLLMTYYSENYKGKIRFVNKSAYDFLKTKTSLKIQENNGIYEVELK